MQRFSYETNGYNRHEVNQFIEYIISQTESLISKSKLQKNEIENLNKILNHYSNIENSLKDAISKTEKACEIMVKIASEEANTIINDAKNNADIIVNEALMKSEKIENNNKKLEQKARNIEEKLKIIIEQQLLLAEEIKAFYLDDN